MDELLLNHAKCEHPQCWPKYDSEDAKNMTPDQVRAKYPRFDGYCPDCNAHLILYASFEHYIAGDW